MSDKTSALIIGSPLVSQRVVWSEVMLAEVDHHPMGFFIKLDGKNQDTNKKDQAKIWLRADDAAHLVASLEHVILTKGSEHAKRQLKQAKEMIA